MNEQKISTSLSCTEYVRLKAEERRRRLGIKPRDKITDVQMAEIFELRQKGVAYYAIRMKYPIGHAKLKKMCEDAGYGDDKVRNVDKKTEPSQTVSTIMPDIISP